MAVRGKLAEADACSSLSFGSLDTGCGVDLPRATGMSMHAAAAAFLPHLCPVCGDGHAVRQMTYLKQSILPAKPHCLG